LRRRSALFKASSFLPLPKALRNGIEDAMALASEMQMQQMPLKRHHGILDAMAMQWQEEKS
jgi:hypothetical protein